MRGPGAQVLLDAWEHALDRSPTGRALTLLATAAPGTPDEALADLALGERDLGLLRLRAALFGTRLEAVSSCPGCGAELDVAFDLADLLGPLLADLDPVAARGRQPHRVVLEGYHATVLAPSSSDVLAVLEDPDAGEQALLARCVTELTGPDGVPAEEAVPTSVTDALVAEIEAMDPYARIELDLACAGCAHTWPADLDVAGFVWAEVDTWARRLLRDVHTLARAYGWREADILAMGPRRRQGYLELVQA